MGPLSTLALNHSKVVLDSRLIDDLKSYKTLAGIMVARPVR